MRCCSSSSRSSIRRRAAAAAIAPRWQGKPAAATTTKYFSASIVPHFYHHHHHHRHRHEAGASLSSSTSTSPSLSSLSLLASSSSSSPSAAGGGRSIPTVAATGMVAPLILRSSSASVIGGGGGDYILRLLRRRSFIVSFFHTTSLALQGLIYNFNNPDRPPRLLVVQPRVFPQACLRPTLLEALRLASSLEELRQGCQKDEGEVLPPYLVVQSPELRRSKNKRKRVRADAYFGSGTIENVRTQVVVYDSQDGVDAVFVNTTLTAVQQRNLERAWGKPVLDRVGLIIEIFSAHAETKEARLQVELAALNYKKSRLVRMPAKDGRLTFGMNFESEVVSARGRGSGGGRGFISGAGETEIQLQRRRIAERKDRLTAMLKEVRRTRSLHRDARRKQVGGQGNRIPVVAVVGYTNAGKSSLVSALSRTKLYIDDKLFATLDPRSRSVTLPSGQAVILSDTVGFISDLPIQLVEAFHATLEEVVEADFLLHVIDSSASNAEEQRMAVLQVLDSIGVPKEKIKNRMIEVWNKIDLSSNSATDHNEKLKLDSVESTHDSPTATIDMEENSGDEDDEDNGEDTTIEVTADNDEDTVEAIEDSNDDDDDDECEDNNGDTLEVDEDLLETQSTHANTSLSWSSDGVSRIGISVVEGTGLKELLQLLDENILSSQKPTSSESEA